MYKKLNTRLFNNSIVIPETIKKLPLAKRVALLNKLKSINYCYTDKSLNNVRTISR